MLSLLPDLAHFISFSCLHMLVLPDYVSLNICG